MTRTPCLGRSLFALSTSFSVCVMRCFARSASSSSFVSAIVLLCYAALLNYDPRSVAGFNVKRAQPGTFEIQRLHHQISVPAVILRAQHRLFILPSPDVCRNVLAILRVS